MGFTDSSDWLLWGLLIVQMVVGFTDSSDWLLWGLLIVQTGCCGVY